MLFFIAFQMSKEENNSESAANTTNETVLKVDEILAEFLSKKINDDEDVHKKAKKKKKHKVSHLKIMAQSIYSN